MVRNVSERPTPGAIVADGRRRLLRRHARDAEIQQRTDQLEAHGRALRAEIAELQRRLDEPSRHVDELARRLATLDAESHAIPFMHGSPFTIRQVPDVGVVLGYTDPPAAAGRDYRAFEDVFRGDEDFIRDRQRRYLPIVAGHEPVLDFGCGRGEFLDLLRDAGTAYMGVDQHPSMVARCHEKGHASVTLTEGLSYLQQTADRSLGVLFSAQVIEHLTVGDFSGMLALARQKLSPDGVFIAETVNPHSPPALKTFWVDLTHQHPIFPEVALEFCREAGFPSAYVFHPNGTGDVEVDRFTQGEYAVVAHMAVGA